MGNMSYTLFVGSSMQKKSDIWKNYCNTFAAEAALHPTMSKFAIAVDKLTEHNAVDVINSPYIIFESEIDAMAFSLKFS